jgi:hypothetical protein
MLAQWQHDQIARPRDQITEKYLGGSPMQNQRVYFDSSPMSFTTTDRRRALFLIIHGTADDVVDPATQAFQNALNQAGIYVRRFVIPGAGKAGNIGSRSALRSSIMTLLPIGVRGLERRRFCTAVDRAARYRGSVMRPRIARFRNPAGVDRSTIVRAGGMSRCGSSPA